MKFQTYICALASTTQAWWEGGHNLIARLAVDQLEKDDPLVLKKVDSLLKVLETKESMTTGETLTSREGQHPLMEAVNFADDLNDKDQVHKYNEGDGTYHGTNKW